MLFNSKLFEFLIFLPTYLYFIIFLSKYINSGVGVLLGLVLIYVLGVFYHNYIRLPSRRGIDVKTRCIKIFVTESFIIAILTYIFS